jgi:antitoxin component of MazEF toxin-antitoxin module
MEKREGPRAQPRVRSSRCPAEDTHSLDDLLARITDANLHGETDWGPPRGREAW